MPTSTASLAISYLAIYALLTPPIFYTLLRHGRYGILGWAYLLAFCLLCMTGAGLQLSNSSNQTAQIISGLGLSPLMLAVAGVLHESSHYISDQTRRPLLLGTASYVILHVVVGGAVGLVVAGSTSAPSNAGVGCAGDFVFLLVWGVVVALCALSYGYAKRSIDARRLLYATMASLPFLGIRIIYAVAAAFDADISPYTGPIAYRVVLAALMEFVVVVEFVVVGVWTRNISRNSKVTSDDGLPLRQREYGWVVPGGK